MFFYASIYDTFVRNCFTGIYKLAYENAHFGISREQCAKSVLPFLIATSVENTLNLSQFEQFFAMIHVMLQKVNLHFNSF